MKNKAALLEEGNALLVRVRKEREPFFQDYIENEVLSECNIQELRIWLLNVEAFVEKYGMKCHQERMIELRWIINQNRVNVGRIKSILTLIEQIDEPTD